MAIIDMATDMHGVGVIGQQVTVGTPKPWSLVLLEAPPESQLTIVTASDGILRVRIHGPWERDIPGAVKLDGENCFVIVPGAV